MSQIWITKNGFRATHWDGDLRQDVDEPIHDIFHYLRQTCHIEVGVTLLDIFNAVDKYPELIEVIEGYSWCNVKAFHKEARKPGTTDLTAIQISKHINFGRHDTGEHNNVHGIGPDKDGVIIDNWAIDFSPVSEIKDLPVLLDPDIPVYNDKYEKVFDGKGEAYFNLMEVLGEIYFEISFHGSPEDRDERLQELKDIKQGIEDGTIKTKPFESLRPKDTIQ